MYGYASDSNITAQQVLQKVTQEQIFEFILEEPFDINERYLSPLRDDTKPGCRFDVREDGTILFIDFGDKVQTHNTCFGLVMRKHNFNLGTAISLILSHFNLSDDSSDYTPTDRIFNTVHDSGTQTSAIITYDKIDYIRRDKLYWSQSQIQIPQLIEDNVFNTNKFYIEKEGKPKRAIHVYAPCYAIDFVSRVKLYQPYSDKYKFITNCDENNIGNFDNLPPMGDVLVIGKSYKDHRVIRNFLLKLHVIWFQNEGCVPALEILKNLTQRFIKIVVFYDNDEAGVKAAMKIVRILNHLRPDCAVMIHLPIRVDRTRQWKDPAKFIQKEGQYDLIYTFKELLLWQNIRLL